MLSVPCTQDEYDVRRWRVHRSGVALRTRRVTAPSKTIVLTGATGYVGGALLPRLTALMAPGVYDIPVLETAFRSVSTNTTPVGAYRGAGRPEATAAIERAMDLFAAELGMDPAEVRRINFVAPFSEPWTSKGGAVYDSGDYPAALQSALDAADYRGLRAEQAARRARGDVRQLGIGHRPLVEATLKSSLTDIALQEIIAGKLTFEEVPAEPAKA